MFIRSPQRNAEGFGVGAGVGLHGGEVEVGATWCNGGGAVVSLVNDIVIEDVAVGR